MIYKHMCLHMCNVLCMDIPVGQSSPDRRHDDARSWINEMLRKTAEFSGVKRRKLTVLQKNMEERDWIWT